jgi:hypothetical protein
LSMLIKTAAEAMPLTSNEIKATARIAANFFCTDHTSIMEQ